MSNQTSRFFDLASSRILRWAARELAARPAFEVVGIGDHLAVGEVADHEDDVGVLGPDGLGHGLESLPVLLVHGLFVAQLQVLEPVGLRVAVRGPLAAPLAVGRPVGVLDEVGHVLRRFVHVEGRDGDEIGRLADVEEVENPPAVGRIRDTTSRRAGPAVARADHLLPAVLRVVDHRPAIAQDGDPLVDQAHPPRPCDRAGRWNRPHSPGWRKA